MLNFAIRFSHPWLLLLLIPAIVFAILPYFFLNKKYRRTRNRITSMVLHIIIMVLAISVLAGIHFTYQVPNPENEIILLIDVSDTEEQSKARRDEFVQTVLDEGAYDGYKIGIVTFGFTQQYAVPLTYDVEEIYDAYKSAPLPDTSATDVAAALRFASDCFKTRESGKIVLITDGKETDESAANIIRSISAQGTKVDTVYISSEYEADSVQIVGVSYPDYHFGVNEDFKLNVSLYSKSGATDAVIELYDNGEFDEEKGIQTANLPAGLQEIEFDANFETEGLHEIRVKISESADNFTNNNEYRSYFFLVQFNKVLIIDQGTNAGESDQIAELLTSAEPGYDVEQLHIMTTDPTEIPKTVDDLCEYDQVILNNIASSDLQYAGIEEILYSYVYERGGGLFTVGGNDEKGEAHAYNRHDLNNSILKELLPVQAIEYTPPVGVVIVIDVSGSMSGGPLDWAKSGATVCLDALTERDYVGIMTLGSDYGTALQLTSRTEETLIKEAINGVEIGGSTEYYPSIERAGRALVSEKRVDRRHIIIVSDGAPTDNEYDKDDKEGYLTLTEKLHREDGITLSVVGIGISEGSDFAQKMQRLTDTGGGKLYYADNEQKLLSSLLEDLNAPAIKELYEEPFHPQVSNLFSNVLKDVEYGDVSYQDEKGDTIEMSNALDATLNGFYGVKARATADTILVGEFSVPIYAQWKFGAGMVGSFMSDLSGNWSENFLSDENAQKLLRNIVFNLMPTESIRPSGIRVELREENYFNQLSVIPNLEDGQTVEAQLIEITKDGEVATSLTTPPEGEVSTDGNYVSQYLSAENGFTRCTIVIKKAGIYKIVVTKKDAEGNVIATGEVYKSFSFSKEYDAFVEEGELSPDAYLQDLAKKGNGNYVLEENPWDVYLDFVTALNRSYDPRIILMVIAMVLFLADIAVRKFKFKWPHELWREYKEKRATRQQ